MSYYLEKELKELDVAIFAALSKLNEITDKMKTGDNHEFADKNQRFGNAAKFDEADYAILCETETMIEMLNRRHAELSQLRDFQNSCDHEFLDDLVDVNPDKSVAVKYCKHCCYCQS